MLHTMLGNMWTTIIGVLLGMLTYLQANGTSLPTTRAGWLAFLIAALMAALGTVSKDATTGSRPPGA